MEKTFPKKKELFEDFIKNVLVKNFEHDNPHPGDVHIGLDDNEMITRLILQTKPTSTFIDEIDYKQCLYNIIMENYYKIKTAHEKLKENERIELTFKDQRYHYGITQTLSSDVKKVKSKKITAFLEKKDDTKYGFQLITMFPNIDDHNTEIEDVNIKEILKTSDGYLKTSALKRLYFEIATEKNRPCSLLSLRKLLLMESDTIQLEVKDKNDPFTRYRVIIDNKKTQWTKVIIQNDENKKSRQYTNIKGANKITLSLEYPDFVAYASKIQTRFDELKSEKYNDVQRYIQKKHDSAN